jgi:hypothetical protein
MPGRNGASKAKLSSNEPSKFELVEENTGDVRSDWGEEERRNVAAFFTLLDQWDRTTREEREVA